MWHLWKINCTPLVEVVKSGLATCQRQGPLTGSLVFDCFLCYIYFVTIWVMMLSVCLCSFFIGHWDRCMFWSVLHLLIRCFFVFFKIFFLKKTTCCSRFCKTAIWVGGYRSASWKCCHTWAADPFPCSALVIGVTKSSKISWVSKTTKQVNQMLAFLF